MIKKSMKNPAKNLGKIIMIFLLIFLADCSNISYKNQPTFSIDNGDKWIDVQIEIADDNEERMKGLMFRENLGENSGMLFIFEDESTQSFWMKNTLIPLDIIFINEGFEIVDIKNAVPCTADPCRIYSSEKPAKFVLEVNSGFAAKNGISIGDKTILNE